MLEPIGNLRPLHEGPMTIRNLDRMLNPSSVALIGASNGGNPKELKSAGIVPDMMKRGAVRAVYDGRYTLARYFSPKQHNRPTTLEEIYRFNDVELFDLQADPLEMNYLAMKGQQHRELVVGMNEKLNRLIDAEVGEDRGQMLPGSVEAGWEVTPETMAGT
jgi:arylsulfatase